MRILHTADWHLGQNLMYRDRSVEHEMALDWLLAQLEEQQAEGLLIAGDIFDIPNPPNYARKLYYAFLTRLQRTSCRHVLIVGGNHDSPSMLEAPAQLLELLQITVIGAAPENPDKAIIEWRDNGELRAVVAAVPYLRDRDLKSAVAGESSEERIRRIQEGIHRHYRRMAERLAPYREQNVPLLTTGHLYAKGAAASAAQDNIYIGNLENIDPARMPDLFDYVALGHLHRAQAVGGKEHIRYSGSLLPLSFQEMKDEKGAVLLDFDGKRLREARQLVAPTFRRLKTVRGEGEQLREKLRAFATRDHGPLTPWVEVALPGHSAPPAFTSALREFVQDEGLDLEILKISLERSGEGPENWEEEEGDLHALSDLEVFTRRCEEAGCDDAETRWLVDSFRELIAWIQDQDDADV